MFVRTVSANQSVKLLNVGLVSVLMVIVNAMAMIFLVRPEYETLSYFVVPFLLPRMLTERGLRCRRRFWLYFTKHRTAEPEPLPLLVERDSANFRCEGKTHCSEMVSCESQHCGH